jgi:116 kDa U5 small nuclear ribonucleoprotein component
MDDITADYDEWGNYIGPSLDNDAVPTTAEEELPETASQRFEEDLDEDQELAVAMKETSSNAIVLHEDKQYYPDSSDIYGEAEVLVQDEDTQALNEPIIASAKFKTFSVLEKAAPETIVCIPMNCIA